MNKPRFPEQPDLFAAPAVDSTPADAPVPDPPPQRPSSPSRHGKLFSIAPHAPFLATLADRVLDGTLLGGWPREGPFWLTDVTIILPTRRARLALAEAFAARGHGLLPDIRTFGGEPQDEEPFLGISDPSALPPAVSATERRLVLASLIEAWAKTPHGAEVLATPPNAAEIVGLADSLAELVDDLEIAGVRATAVRSLPPEDVQANWQHVLKFLEVALAAWPAHLAENGKADAATLRNLRLRRQAEAASLLFGERPVIAAGSTGSIPATAALMKAIAALPRGALVLPGLDTTLTPERHAALLDNDRNPHGHPQYGLAQLLRHLGAGPGEVAELVDGGSAPRPARRAVRRTEIVRAALGLADDTANWAEARARLAPDLAAATQGLALIAARSEDEEARAIALCARDALGREQSVGIVTPDRTLARRIAAELRRFGVDVDDTAGTPLFQSPAGRLARLLLALVETDYAPVELVALLRHPATTLGLERRAVVRMADRIERCLLRGAHLLPGLAGLRAALAANGAEGDRRPRLAPEEKIAIADLFMRLEDSLAPLAARPRSAAGLAAAVQKAFIGVAESGQEGEAELGAWAADLAVHPDRGPRLPESGRDNVLSALMAGYTVPPSAVRRREDIAIWGLLEARLQSRNLLILCGLNEDVWPQPAEPGPWLSRAMRLALGMEPPERRQGQVAHDFEMAVGNPLSVIAYSDRIGTSPALPSRLVQRLTAFLGDEITRDIMERGAMWLRHAQAIDIALELRRAERPAPRPPATARPRRLSVTEVETLFRSPYDIYAKYTLNLRALAPLGELPGARDRGSIVHDIFGDFIAGHDVMAPDALERLEVLAVERFGGLESIAARRDIWRHRFRVAARQFLAYERARQHRVAARHAEIAGVWTMPNGLTLTGRADRIDILVDGTAELIDFKTGSVPEPGTMRDLQAPQLPLEAAMLAAGAFPGLEPAAASALTYIKIGLGPAAFVVKPFALREGFDVAATADAVRSHLSRHAETLLMDDRLPMVPRVLPVHRQRFAGDYDHLARVDEWSINEGDESE